MYIVNVVRTRRACITALNCTCTVTCTCCMDPSYMYNCQCAYMCILYGALLRKSKNIEFLDVRTLLTCITDNVRTCACCMDTWYMYNGQYAYMCILYGALLRKSKNIDFLDVRTLLTCITDCGCIIQPCIIQSCWCLIHPLWLYNTAPVGV